MSFIGADTNYTTHQITELIELLKNSVEKTCRDECFLVAVLLFYHWMLCVCVVWAVIFTNIPKYKYKVINPTLCRGMIGNTVHAQIHAYAQLIH